jgi:hypothetical protein
MTAPKRPDLSVVHGDLVIDIPSTWADQSVLHFVAPADGLPRTATGGGPAPQVTESVSVRFGRLPTGGAAGVLANERKNLLRDDPALKLVAEEAINTRLGPGHLAAWRFRPLDVALVKLVVAIAHGDAYVVAIATTTEALFPTARSRLLDVIGSLRRRT